jgi:hypothetical protein
MSAAEKQKHTILYTFRPICELRLWLSSLLSVVLPRHYFFPSSFPALLQSPSHSLFRFMSPCSFSQMSYLHFGCSSTLYYQDAAAHSKWPYLEAIEGDICVIREELNVPCAKEGFADAVV